MKTLSASQLPSIVAVKKQAKRLRAKLAAHGSVVGHSQVLEVIAHQYGYRDWNTFHAAIGNHPPAVWNIGDRVRGRYLGQSFSAVILAVEMIRPGWFRLTLDLDEAIDVVTFDSFSNFRKRVTGVIGPAGTSREKTSDGQPQLEMNAP
jgi:hypothetical protein